MRKTPPDILEKGRRLQTGTDRGFTGEMCGRFLVLNRIDPTTYISIISGDGKDWQSLGLPMPAFEHVSCQIHVPGNGYRTPTWDEMCFVKDLFWDDDECVLQYHPPKSSYVNITKNVLHLWKPVDFSIPLPPKQCV